MHNVVVSGSFDAMCSRHIRLLEEAAKLGSLHVHLWSDGVVRRRMGREPKYTEEERAYLLQAVRYVDRVSLLDESWDTESIPIADEDRPLAWVVMEEDDSARKRSFSVAKAIAYHVLPQRELARLPRAPRKVAENDSVRNKVVVTGCFDWLHSGHVRFFEETSGLGELYVVLGSDANVQLLKGDGHPQFSEDERWYMVQSLRYVRQAMISTGQGWMDAEPEITLIKPDIYAVNEDGDKPEKRNFCDEHDLDYVVLRRLPKEGLPKRTSTELRGY